MKRQALTILGASLVALAFAGCSTTPAETSQTAYTTPATLSCNMSYSLSGWSAIYKHASGSGVVTCANGKSMSVTLTVTGGGLTAGKWKIDNGSGNFSDVHQITDVLGSYVQGSAHAGAVKSAQAQVLTKGPVSLALAGTGQGVGVGVAVSKFTIKQQ